MTNRCEVEFSSTCSIISGAPVVDSLAVWKVTKIPFDSPKSAYTADLTFHYGDNSVSTGQKIYNTDDQVTVRGSYEFPGHSPGQYQGYYKINWGESSGCELGSGLTNLDSWEQPFVVDVSDSGCEIYDKVLIATAADIEGRYDTKCQAQISTKCSWQNQAGNIVSTLTSSVNFRVDPVTGQLPDNYQAEVFYQWTPTLTTSTSESRYEFGIEQAESQSFAYTMPGVYQAAWSVEFGSDSGCHGSSYSGNFVVSSTNERGCELQNGVLTPGKESSDLPPPPDTQSPESEADMPHQSSNSSGEGNVPKPITSATEEESEEQETLNETTVAPAPAVDDGTSVTTPNLPQGDSSADQAGAPPNEQNNGIPSATTIGGPHLLALALLVSLAYISI